MKWIIFSTLLVVSMITTDAKANLVTPLSDLAVLKKSVLVPEETFDAFLARFGWTWHQVARGEYPAGFRSLDELQLACICEDPVLWAKSFLREPSDPDHKDPWKFFEYQEASARCRQNVLHEDAAEVGKTREIVVLTSWYGHTFKGGSGLVAAPLTQYLLEIIDAQLDQFSWNPVLGRCLKNHRKQPYHQITYTNGFKTEYRPSDFDGGPFRGVHVRNFGIVDEAVKNKNRKQWSEFFRALLPGAEVRAYSVPDGDRETEFYRFCARAPKYNYSSGAFELSKEAEEAAGKDKSAREFVKFNWSKELMPPPFWTPERRREFIDFYGGETSPGYVHNVLGGWGDPESAVFPSWQFNPCVKDLPGSRTLKVVVDAAHGEVSLFGASYALISGDIGETGSFTSKETVLLDRRMSKDALFRRGPDGGSEFKRLIKSFFSTAAGANSGGADFGFSEDPSEVRIWNRVGRTRQAVARLHMRHVEYDHQAEALDALDDLYDDGNQTMPWGLDFGNAGTAVVQRLNNDPRYSGKRYEDRVLGVQFGSTMESVNKDGETIEDQKTGKAVKVSAKELGTNLISADIQARERLYSPDPEVMLAYTNHTAREGSRGRIFDKVNDHVIDADRAEALAEVMMKDAGGEVFSCGANLRNKS